MALCGELPLPHSQKGSRMVEYRTAAGLTVMVSEEDALALNEDLFRYGSQVVKIPPQATNGIKCGYRLHPAMLLMPNT